MATGQKADTVAVEGLLPPDYRDLSPLQLLEGEWGRARAGLGRVTILVSGRTGAGKSTLVNAVFRKDVAATGTGEPVTRHIHPHVHPELPLTLYDTPGVELSARQAQEVAGEFLDLVDEKLRGRPEDHIHLVWYCVNAEDRRLEDYQVDLVRSFADKVPVILVMTQCLGRGSDEAVAFARSLEELHLPVVRRAPVPVLARPRTIAGTTIEPFGLDQLVRLSYETLPEAQRQAFANAQRISVELKADQARTVVARCTAAAATIGFAPNLPVLDAVPLVALQMGMLTRINVIMGFERSDIDVIATTLLGPLGALLVGQNASRFLLRLFPGVGNIVNGALAGSLTRGLGHAYVDLCSTILTRRLDGESVTAQDVAHLARRLLDQLRPFTGDA